MCLRIREVMTAPIHSLTAHIVRMVDVMCMMVCRVGGIAGRAGLYVVSRLAIVVMVIVLTSMGPIPFMLGGLFIVCGGF